MDLFTKVLPYDLVKAIFNTLIHSLWQGLVLAILVGAVMIFTRNVAPSRRYQILIALLFVFTFTVVGTLCYELREHVIPEQLLFKQYPVVDVFGRPLLGDSVKIDNYQLVFSFLTNYSHVIITLWVLVMFIKTFKLLTDLQFIYHLRRRNIFPLGEEWEKKGQTLATQLGITQMVSIAESGIARIPMVIGHFKPLILIPIGLATSLPTADIEAILIHELAHVYRRDYLVNVLVSLVEILFFFNPAVLWTAGLIRQERENCCDDIAVKHTGNKVAYIKALVACQEYQLTAPMYAMALNGQKKHLSSRVKRLISNNNPSLNAIEKTLVAACLVVVVLLTTAFTNTEKINKIVTAASRTILDAGKSFMNTDEPKTNEVKEISSPSPTTLFGKDASTSLIGKQNDYTLEFKIFLPEQIGEHTSIVVPNGDLQTQLIKHDGVLYQINSNKNRVISLQRNGCSVLPVEVPKYISLVDSLHKIDKSLAILPSLKSKGDVIYTKHNYQQKRLDYIADSSYKHLPYAINDGRKTGVEKQISGNMRVEVPIAVTVDKATGDEDLSKIILNAISKEGLADKVESYKLTENELTINGKVINSLAFQRLMDKYIKSFSKRTIAYYNYEIITTVTTKPSENRP